MQRDTRDSLILMGVLFFALSVGHCENMTVAPTPKPDHEVMNRISLFASAGIRTADTVQTCHNLTRRGWREAQIPTQSCAGVAAWNAGAVLAGWAVQKTFHRLGWHRAESIPNWLSVAGSAQGIAYSSTRR